MVEFCRVPVIATIEGQTKNLKKTINKANIAKIIQNHESPGGRIGILSVIENNKQYTLISINGSRIHGLIPALI